MILDTNALSGFLGGNVAVRNTIRMATKIAVPVIVIGEYQFGLLSSKQRHQLEIDFQKFLMDVTVLPIMQATCLHYATIRQQLRQIGKPIPQNDGWIAALALQYGMPILSRDTHFDNVPGIARTSWPA